MTDPEPIAAEPSAPSPEPSAPSAPAPAAEPDRRPRPLIERVGMAAIALVLGLLFGTVAVAAFVSGELFLATMGAIGCVMTFWVGGLTLFRG
jgi:hypothetical protein